MGQAKNLGLRQQSDVLPRSTQDYLTRLPLELIHIICLSLDIPAISNLRRTCRTAKSIIEGYSPYRRLAAQSPWIIRAMLKAGATYPTCAKVYASLRSATCSLCDTQMKCDFDAGGESTNLEVLVRAGYLYLPTADTICWACFDTNHRPNRLRDLTPWSEPHLRKHLSELRRGRRRRGEDLAPLDWSRTRLLPCLRGLPKMPHPAETVKRARTKVHHDWGWLRPRLYDAQAVNEMFGIGFGQMTRLRDIGFRCSCTVNGFPSKDRQEMKRVALPLVVKEGSEELFAHHQAFYDQAPKGFRPRYMIGTHYNWLVTP
jgi:hypothetical protein